MAFDHYGRFDPATGVPTGFYNTEIYPDVVVYGEVPPATDADPDPVAPELSRTRNPGIPAEAVPITAAQWQELICNQGSTAWNGTDVVPYAPPAAPVPVPAMVSNFQARAALVAAGLFAKADAAVRALGDALTIQAWDYANNFYRASAMIAALATALDLTDAQVDDLFRAADAVAT